METCLSPIDMSTWVARKDNDRRTLCQEKMLPQFPVGSSSDRLEDRILLLTLLKGLLNNYSKKETMNAMTRTREAMPPARWRRGFIGLCGFDGLLHRIYKSTRL